MPPVDYVTHAKSGLPIRPELDASPAQRPGHSTLRGRLATVVPLDPTAHEEALYEGTHGPDREKLWLYMGAGPFADRASFRAYLDTLAASSDPLSFVIVDNASERATGHASYMRMAPEHRVIEVGNIFYTPSLARSAAATEAMYLMARHIFEDLNYRRYQWKCNALNAPSRRAALRLGFCLKAFFVSTSSKRAAAATPLGLPCSITNGRRERPDLKRGCGRRISMKAADSGRRFLP